MRRLAAAVLLALVVAAPLVAAAAAGLRPGGGHSYSGGGGGYSGGGGGGGGGDGAELFFLLELLFHYPQLGVPVLVVVVVVVLLRQRSQRSFAASTWDSGEFHAEPPPPPRPAPAGAGLAGLREDDPDFSPVLFEDFVYSLYARAHRARHEAAELARLAPYLTETARAQLAALGAGAAPVTAVVVGAASVVRVRRQEGLDWVRVAFEANLVAGDTEYVLEHWIFERAVGARTRPWKGARTFECPNCAAPATRWDENRCEYCGEIVEAGRFDWALHSIERLASERRPPSLTGTAPEIGTDQPTVYDAGAQAAWAGLVAEDPALSPESFGARVGLVYAELNRGWNAGDPRLVRPWVSDGLFAYLEYWLEAYRAQGLRNLLEDAAISSWTIARVTRDRHYDAVTVRLFASGRDYTVSVADGRVVGGSKSRARAYSEYWTFVRAAGRRGAPRADRGCPNCGAELQAGMGGTCAHCGAVVTRGDFDWVLSRIEQDESYRG